MDQANPETTKDAASAPPIALDLGAFSRATIHLGKLDILLKDK